MKLLRKNLNGPCAMFAVGVIVIFLFIQIKCIEAPPPPRPRPQRPPPPPGPPPSPGQPPLGLSTGQGHGISHEEYYDPLQGRRKGYHSPADPPMPPGPAGGLRIMGSPEEHVTTGGRQANHLLPAGIVQQSSSQGPSTSRMMNPLYADRKEVNKIHMQQRPPSKPSIAATSDTRHMMSHGRLRPIQQRFRYHHHGSAALNQNVDEHIKSHTTGEGKFSVAHHGTQRGGSPPRRPGGGHGRR